MRIIEPPINCRAIPIEYEIHRDCWVCVSHKSNNSGYAFLDRNGKHMGVHRYVYRLTFGEIPKGLLICHTCNNKLCINPDHLYAGTYKDNLSDAINSGAHDYCLISSEVREEIRLGLLSRIYTQKELAKMWGVSKSSVSLINLEILRV